jgi:hypothetical protein
MLEALRRDIQRLRSERAGGAAPASAAPVRPAEPIERRPASVTPIKRPADSPPQEPPKKRRKRNQAAIQDEWGFFDPEQCGFAALVAKLDEIADTTDEASAGPPA